MSYTLVIVNLDDTDAPPLVEQRFDSLNEAVAALLTAHIEADFDPDTIKFFPTPDDPSGRQIEIHVEYTELDGDENTTQDGIIYITKEDD
jgi:hypothetical protein